MVCVIVEDLRLMRILEMKGSCLSRRPDSTELYLSINDGNVVKGLVIRSDYLI